MTEQRQPDWKLRQEANLETTRKVADHINELLAKSYPQHDERKV